jgi:hypothetical protein
MQDVKKRKIGIEVIALLVVNHGYTTILIVRVVECIDVNIGIVVIYLIELISKGGY